MALFSGLSEKLQETIKKMRGQGRVTEKDVGDMMRQIKIALLEADVNFKVVKDFIGKVSERAVGQDVFESITPGQQVIKIVHDELVKLMGNEESKITFSSNPPTVYLMVGLQGSGKTTTTGKLANQLRKQGKKPLLVACDVYRPAAVEQLKIVGQQLDIPVFEMGNSKNPVEIAESAVKHANKMMYDVVIVDTAGRLHIDEVLMDELKKIKKAVKPHEILLIVDSMTGQDAVNIAKSFNEQLEIDGIILTKLDGDTRGGAALSIRAVTGKPIKYVGIGEKLSELEPFYPDRMASRILGMGDVVSLVEKAQESFDEKQAIELERKMRNKQFSFDDYLEQIRQVKKMGSMNEIMNMIPGMDSKALRNFDPEESEKKLVKTESIIMSMNKKEKRDPSIINSGRRKRIANGSGTTVQDVNKLMKEFEDMKKMFKMMSQMGKKGNKGMGNFKMPF